MHTVTEQPSNNLINLIEKHPDFKGNLDAFLKKVITSHYYAIEYDNLEISFPTNTACYATFYGALHTKKIKNTKSIIQIISTPLKYNQLIAIISIFCTFCEFEDFELVDLNSKKKGIFNNYIFRIVFDKPVNMTKVKFCLDSIRYCWETTLNENVKVNEEFRKMMRPKTITGLVSNYYKFISKVFCPYGGHGHPLTKLTKPKLQILQDNFNKYFEGNQSNSLHYFMHYMLKLFDND